MRIDGPQQRPAPAPPAEQYDPPAGETIVGAAVATCFRARLRGCPVVMTFNGVHLTVGPDAKVPHVVDSYNLAVALRRIRQVRRARLLRFLVALVATALAVAVAAALYFGRGGAA